MTQRICSAKESLHALSGPELRTRSQRLRDDSLSGPLYQSHMLEALALVREAARRVHGTAHYPQQLLAGWAMWGRNLIEMETGEGKTLTALLPAYLHALSGEGCHVITANDYLAERDAQHAVPIFELLGLSVDWIVSDSSESDRRRAYRADLTFATVTQIGFDFLRDRLRLDGNAFGINPTSVQRPYYAAVVDEADSVLLDEARTPLQIATLAPVEETEARWRCWADDVSGRLQEGVHFHFEARTRQLELTESGCEAVLLDRFPWGLITPCAERLFQLTEQALQARHAYHRDQDYLVQDGRVGIISATTGRILHGRQWQHGLQQAIECREDLELSPHSQPIGAITVQALIGRYPHLCGMSGTLRGSEAELKAVYGLEMCRIAPRRPCLRRRWPCRCFGDRDSKLNAIVIETQRLSALGRPVLVGTPSIETSECLSARLQAAGLPHELLTARQPQREAEIIAMAGTPGCITIATSMAGRGTDIQLTDTARANGGLHVIIAGLQPSHRCDRQLAGRSARQGDPGSYQEFLSLDDELVGELSNPVRRRETAQGRPRSPGELPASWQHWFRRIQFRLEQDAGLARREINRQRRHLDDWASRWGLDPALELMDDTPLAT